MAFVTLEDLQGNIDLVIFPRTWKLVQSFVDFDEIVMVDGKIDTYGAEPKILVDKITTDLKHVMPLEQAASHQRKPASQKKTRTQTSKVISLKQETPSISEDPVSAPTPKKVTEKSDDYVPLDVENDMSWDDDGLPPPPDAFPPEWEDILAPVVPAQTAVEAYSELISAASSDETAPDKDEQLEETNSVTEFGAEAQTSETEAPVISADAPLQKSAVEEFKTTDPIIKAEVSEKVTLPIIHPMPSADGKDVSMITVILRPRADKVRDNLLLRRVFGMMISYPGNDRFAFHIFENRRGHLLEFPNLTTGINPELMERLNKLVGPENIRIEPITFQ